MNKLFFIYLTLTLLACQQIRTEVEFIIINKTPSYVDSIMITNWDSKTISETIQRNDSTILNLDFKNNKQKGDGSYSISFYSGKKKYSKGFGYFSNGNPTNSNYRIEIYNDTIVVKEQMIN